MNQINFATYMSIFAQALNRGDRVTRCMNNGFMVTYFGVHPPSFKIYYAGFTWKIMAS